VQLFPLFGEFNSVKELNEAAKGQLADGDIEAVKKLARENGLEEYDIEDYINGDTDELAVPLSAAMGRLRVEAGEIRKLPKEACVPCLCILEMAQSMCTDEAFSHAVMKKGKRIQKVNKLMYDNRCLCGTDRDLKNILKAYYLKGEKEAKAVIEEIAERYGGKTA
ncbi:MAG: hypothetical protein NC489_38620, partial [Ruminococcus flavefaciens]|nr:hypothetical protein [Ruminococcus flavefaciens]